MAFINPSERMAAPALGHNNFIPSNSVFDESFAKGLRRPENTYNAGPRIESGQNIPMTSSSRREGQVPDLAGKGFNTTKENLIRAGKYSLWVIVPLAFGLIIAAGCGAFKKGYESN